MKEVWDELDRGETDASKVEKKQNIAHKIGTILAKIHNHSMVHGDPTTSNLLVREKDGEIVMIDFGLGSQNASIDDKAVDLYVLERAMLATHPNSEELFSQILSSYEKESRKAKTILSKFESVRARGRKRMAFG